MFRRPLSATLFPYTTLFRSVLAVDLRNPHWQENRPVVHAVEIDTGFENVRVACQTHGGQKSAVGSAPETDPLDRKSTRLNSSHLGISYAVFCLKKKKKTQTN